MSFSGDFRGLGTSLFIMRHAGISKIEKIGLRFQNSFFIERLFCLFGVQNAFPLINSLVEGLNRFI